MKRKIWATLIVTGLVLATLPCLASAGGDFFEDNIEFEGGGRILLTDSGTIFGNDAASFRIYIDDNNGDSDGNLTQSEVDDYISDEIDLGIHGETDLFRLDGEKGTFETVSKIFENITGPTNSIAPFKVTTTTRFHFPVNETRHTFSFTYDTFFPGDGHSNFSFRVPDGWEVTGVTGLEEQNISSDSRTVEGLAPLKVKIDVSFQKVGAENISVYLILAPALVISGISVFLILRKKRKISD